MRGPVGQAKKRPRRVLRGEFIAGTENARHPACRNPYSGSELASNQFSGGRSFLRLPCFLATAREGESQYSDTASKDLTLGADMRVLCLRNHHFGCNRNGRLFLAPPTGGPNATP
jgi:hypothetical protein